MPLPFLLPLFLLGIYHRFNLIYATDTSIRPGIEQQAQKKEKYKTCSQIHTGMESREIQVHELFVRLGLLPYPPRVDSSLCEYVMHGVARPTGLCPRLDLEGRRIKLCSQSEEVDVRQRY